MNKNLKKYLDNVIDDLLRQTTVEVYSNSLYFYTPTGIIHREGDVYMYDDTIAKKYALPDEMEVYDYVEDKYKDILLDLEYDIDYLPKPKRDESVYDYLKRVKKPMNESQDKVERYYNYVIDDIIKNINFVLVDTPANVFVRINIPFRSGRLKIPNRSGLIEINIPGTTISEKNVPFGKYIMEKYGIDPRKEVDSNMFEWMMMWVRFVDKFNPIAQAKVKELLSPYGY